MRGRERLLLLQLLPLPAALLLLLLLLLLCSAGGSIARKTLLGVMLGSGDAGSSCRNNSRAFGDGSRCWSAEGVANVRTVAEAVEAPKYSTSSTSRSNSSKIPKQQMPNASRTYYIAADKVVWEYAPSGGDLCAVPRFSAAADSSRGGGCGGDGGSGAEKQRAGGRFIKAQYRQYKDANFTELVPRTAEWEHLGLLGPALYGAVGEVLRVVFRNHLHYEVNLIPTGGLRVTLAMEAAAVTNAAAWDEPQPMQLQAVEGDDNGAVAAGAAAFAPVHPNGTTTYLWEIPPVAGPAAAAAAAAMATSDNGGTATAVNNSSGGGGVTLTSRLWLYRSTVDPEAHDNAGLVGPVVVAAREAAGPSGRAAEVERDVVAFFAVMTEAASPHATENSAALSQFGSEHYAVNGFVWCNGPLPRTTATTTNAGSNASEVMPPLMASMCRSVRSAGGGSANTSDGCDGGGDGGMSVVMTSGAAAGVAANTSSGDGSTSGTGNGGGGGCARCVTAAPMAAAGAPLVTLRMGERVRWHVASVGDTNGLHNFHWHGQTLEVNGHHVDQFTNIPGDTSSANMKPDQPGLWLLHCHVNLHIDGGMMALYAVEGPPPPPLPPGGQERLYFIAAEEVEWDYLPLGYDNCSAHPQPVNSSHPGFKYLEGPFPAAGGSSGGSNVSNSSGRSGGHSLRLGRRLLKTVFIEYTDATFKTRKLRLPEAAYLGFLGPLLRVEVGDTLKVMLQNRANVVVALHPHGLRYSKANEGAPYADGSATADRADDTVGPGQSYTYTWMVPERAGPGPRDPSSVMWLYHGHHRETDDTNAGMVGVIIVTAKGMARSPDDPRPRDVDREAVFFMSVSDEGASSNFRANLRRVDPMTAANDSAVQALKQDANFKTSLLRHAINGYLYCNMPPTPPFTVGAATRLYVASLGSTMDAHTPDFGGFVFRLRNGHQQPTSADSFMISAGSMVTSDVVFNRPGEFELQCRVSDHITAGMRARYSVVEMAMSRNDTSSSSPGSNNFVTVMNSNDNGLVSNSSGGLPSLPVHAVPAAASIPKSAAPPTPPPPTTNATNIIDSLDSSSAAANGAAVDSAGDGSGGGGSGGGGGGGGSGVTRTYFIQAEPVDWDYAPRGYVRCTDVDMSNKSNTYLQRKANMIGSKYRKALYVGYTDASFAARVEAPPYQGLLGPTLVAEVGDTLVVHFRNNLTDLPYYPVNLGLGGGLLDAGTDPVCAAGRGLLPDAGTASGGGGGGGGSGDGGGGGPRNGSRSGGCVYRWRVPSSAGPTDGDFSTTAYGYTNTLDEVAAPSLGLAGVLLVARRGELHQHPPPPKAVSTAAPLILIADDLPVLPRGVDLLVPLFWQVMDENLSPYLKRNAEAAGVNPSAMAEVLAGGDGGKGGGEGSGAIGSGKGSRHRRRQRALLAGNDEGSDDPWSDISSSWRSAEQGRDEGSSSGAGIEMAMDNIDAEARPPGSSSSLGAAASGGEGPAAGRTTIACSSSSSSSSSRSGGRGGGSGGRGGGGSSAGGAIIAAPGYASDNGPAGKEPSSSSASSAEQEEPLGGEEMDISAGMAMGASSTAGGPFKTSNAKASINGFMYCNLPTMELPAGTTVRWVLLAYGGENGLFHSPYFENQAVQVDLEDLGTQASLMPSVARVADMVADPAGTWLMYSSVHHDFTSGMIGQFIVK